MKKRLLIVCDPYTPPAYIPRLRCLCDHLSAHGWELDVYTEQYSGLPFPHTYPIHEIAVYRTRSHAEWAMKSLWSLLTDWRNRYFSKRVRKAIAGQEYDMVVCCTFSTFPLRAALDIARERQLPLHVDLRDVDEQAPDAQYQSHRQWWVRPFRRLYRNINIRRRNRVLRQANGASCVSPWHVDFLRPLNGRISLIYNGFDETLFRPEDVRTERFTISYVGRLYEQQMQDPTLLLQALKDLDLDLQVCWYTQPAGQARIRQMAEKEGVAHLMEYHDYVPVEQVPAILHSSSVLLVLSNSASQSGAHGIMTTKFFEALGVEKPVLCVRSDEECLAQLIRETNAGIAATTTEDVKRFITDKYAEWKANGYTRQAVVPQARTLFSRQQQAAEFEQILAETLREHAQHCLLTDICWTLFYSNTTFDFLDWLIQVPSYKRLRAFFRSRIGRFGNLLLYRLLRVDVERKLGVRYLQGYSRRELEMLAETFYKEYLKPHRNKGAWKQLKDRDIVIASGTLDIIADAVAKHIQAERVYASRLDFRGEVCTGRLHDFLLEKSELTRRFQSFDVLTDNLTDAALVKQAKQAFIVTYNNRHRWEKTLDKQQNITYIPADGKRY